MTPLRILFAHGPDDEAIWRAGFDLVQAAAALDLPLELGFAGDGLRLAFERDTLGATAPAISAIRRSPCIGTTFARIPRDT